VFFFEEGSFKYRGLLDPPLGLTVLKSSARLMGDVVLWVVVTVAAFTFTAVVSFREAFEAALLTAIILMVIERSGRRDLRAAVIAGVASSIALGVALGAVIYSVFKVLPEKALLEAAMSYVAALVLVTVIVWMARHGPHVKDEVERALAGALSARLVAAVTFVFVFREVLETVLIAAPFIASQPAAAAAGVAAGSLPAVALAAAAYWVGLKLPLRKFFLATSLLLVFVASGLVGYGTHEAIEWMEERGVNLGLLAAKVYSLDIPESHPLHPSSPLGAVLSVLLGWHPQMELARALLQAATLAAGSIYVLKSYKIILR
jgi:high-affinity iron transporter